MQVLSLRVVMTTVARIQCFWWSVVQVLCSLANTVLTLLFQATLDTTYARSFVPWTFGEYDLHLD